MRLNFTLFSLLLLSFTANAQKLTGIWRGYFSSNNGVYREGTREETYKYEIQIDQQTNNGLNGVTYSYKTTVFYGKAELHGIYTAASKSLIIKENKLVDLKIGDKSEPCLMTCYLDYTKIGKLEVLEGTFISINIKDKGDCGSGKVYLERVPTSDFKKEDFLLKKKQDDTAKAKANALVNTTDKPKSQIKLPDAAVKTNKDNLLTKPLSVQPSKPQQQKPQVTVVPKPQPPVVKKEDLKKPVSGKNKPILKDDKTTVTPKPSVGRIPEDAINLKKEDQSTISQETQVKKIPIPKVLLERENNLVKTITTSEEELQIEFYDNGTIDNDTISVYHNNQLVVSNGRLSYSPISFKIKCSKTDSRHEIIVVAENLGDIPPNTAMMIIKGVNNIKERHEIFLASTEQRNAKVIINYVPKE